MEVYGKLLLAVEVEVASMVEVAVEIHLTHLRVQALLVETMVAQALTQQAVAVAVAEQVRLVQLLLYLTQAEQAV